MHLTDAARLTATVILMAFASSAVADTYAIPLGDGTYTYVDSGSAQTVNVGKFSFPPPWLAQSSAQARAALGILTVVEPTPPDPETNTVSGSSVQIVNGVPTRVWQSTSLTAQQIAAQKYAALVDGGSVAVVSNGAAPSLSGTYGITANDKINAAAVTAGLAAGQGLPGSNDTFVYFDVAHHPHVFTPAQWLVFAKALRDYVYAFALAAAGQGAIPATPITIP